jgi:Plasmid pRiA4b ORF-3-like protein
VGSGRTLTQTGRVTLADASELVGLLGTQDRLHPKIGDRVFRTKSSEELPGTTTVVTWAKACRLVRVTGGRLVGVQRNAGLLDHPMELWARMFETFPRLGAALCLPGWGESLLRRHFEEGIGAVLAAMARRGGPITLGEVCRLAWETVTAGYVLDDATDRQLATWRAVNDRDVRHALEVLQRLGAVHRSNRESGELSELALWALGRRLGAPAPGAPVFQVKITLAEVDDPPVWRRLLLPANMRLDRLHQVIQAAMGWENYHLHVFSDGRTRYGVPDPELGFRDERRATLRDLIPRATVATPATPTTSVTTGSMRSWSSRCPPPSRACATRSAWRARAPARPRTAAGHGGTRTFARSLPTPPTRNMTTFSRG